MLKVSTTNMNSTIRIALILISLAAVTAVSGDSDREIPRSWVSWIVFLFEQDPQAPLHFCRGSLISSTFVLSAAQCFHRKETNVLQPEDVVATFGVFNLTNANEEGRISLHPKTIIIHEDWNPRTQDADLALLEFDAGKIFLRDLYIRPMYLWHSSIEPPMAEGIVVEWEKSGNESSDQSELPNQLKVDMRQSCLLNSIQTSEKTFCVRYQNTPVTDLGDRGSGLIILGEPIPYLKGIKSTSLQTNSFTAVFTDVLMFKDWIVNNTHAFNHLHCKYLLKKSSNLPFGHINCIIDQAVDSEESVLGSDFDPDIRSFDFQDNQLMRFLPKNIGQKMPMLIDFRGSNASLTVVRDFYFKNMTRVIFMDLASNRIQTIEAGAFNDLIKTEKLWLQLNMIETLDENLFVTMVNLREVHLNGNKLKVLGPRTFPTTGKLLKLIDLSSNVCIDKSYNASTFDHLEADLLSNCVV